MEKKVFIREIKANIPRLLSLFDFDRTSSSYGVGDRFYWAWGLIDFNNVGFQGAANGLTGLWSSGLWPYQTEKHLFINRIDAIFFAARQSTSKDGSISQAFPREGSYALTAFVAYDLLCAISNMKDSLGAAHRQSWIDTVEPMVRYLVKANETHGVISNHLAGAVAALVRWNCLTGDSSVLEKAREQLNRILKYQSQEGWYLEYEGADPGYQTLCTHYLADVHINRPDWGLIEPLTRSIKFLQFFAHPDGSFGGIYGSRNTRFLYPSGIFALANEIPEARALANFMEESIINQRVITLSAVDEPNLVPFFNSYAWTAVLCRKKSQEGLPVLLPCQEWVRRQMYFSEAGIFIDSGLDHYTIISTHKGGVVYHFNRDGSCKLDAGIVVNNGSGQLASTQSYNATNFVQHTESTMTIVSQLVVMPKQTPTPFQFVVLRLLSLTLFRSYRVREKIKQMLVRLLITNKISWPIRNSRTISLGPNLRIADDISLSSGYSMCDKPGMFVSIHMASQGYWQVQDELTHKKHN